MNILIEKEESSEKCACCEFHNRNGKRMNINFDKSFELHQLKRRVTIWKNKKKKKQEYNEAQYLWIKKINSFIYFFENAIRNIKGREIRGINKVGELEDVGSI